MLSKEKVKMYKKKYWTSDLITDRFRPKTIYLMGICCSSDKYAALRDKIKTPATYQ